MRLRRRHIRRGARRSGSTSPSSTSTFPDPTDYDVIVPLGARWPVYDEALRRTWVGAEMKMVRDAADAGVPTLGVCFGGQLLAQAFGGAVGSLGHTRDRLVRRGQRRRELIPGGQWFQWHFDTWTLPPGATEIARTANASQAFVLGRRSGCSSTRRSITTARGVARRRSRRRGGQLRPDPRRITFGEQRNTKPDAARRIRDLVRGFFDGSRISRAPADEQGRRRRSRAGTGARARSVWSGPPAGRPLRVHGRPALPSSSRGPNDGTGRIAGRCNTPANVFV